ncbi:hypothetical protein COEREDRAFT_8648 [Coemansia reversa NRRL 1564]|uniref:BSD domain-containing protein n=1 Tax=Coemansia reversa (strain ATCC 12441 / NRRL 1564) TaxID=763665 RepID=A0A2G5BB47_COERN|nr:hypothetical protein COEREDRAFT_8648 [Coemansia reversa NRRL 1564]|eukprot:PIA16235.1 hypothetical protein COEREDRAFT_8648 [Coemansia reversa NRRL 1564]
MDEYALQFSTGAADAEGCGQNNDSASKTLRTEEKQTNDKEQNATETDLPTLNTMFGFAANWGRKLQSELQLESFVDQVKKQSEQVAKAYSQDISEFAQAVRTGATRGIDELSTRFNQLKNDLETEGNVDENTPVAERTVQTNLEKSSVFETLKKQQQKTKRLLSRLGTDLEDLLRDAIVIEAPGSASTEEQRNAARKIIYDRRMAQLAAIQESESTYLIDPHTSTDSTPSLVTKDNLSNEEEKSDSDTLTNKKQQINDYDKFAAELSLDDRKDEMTRLLEVNPAMADIHKRIVPDKVSDIVFWTRYFFNVWKVEQEEIRRRKLVEAAVAATKEDEFSWDMDDDGDASGVTSQNKEIESSDGDKNKADAKLATEPEPKTEAAVKTVDKEDDSSAVEVTKDSDTPKPSQEKSVEKKASSNNEDDDAWDKWE